MKVCRKKEKRNENKSNESFFDLTIKRINYDKNVVKCGGKCKARKLVDLFAARTRTR